MPTKQTPKITEKVIVMGEINAMNCMMAMEKLIVIEWEKVDTLQLYITSEGGLISYCFALIDYLESLRIKHKFKIKTYALGEASSAGFYIFLLGDERIASPSCRMFIHEHLTTTLEQPYRERIKDEFDQKMIYATYTEYTARRLDIPLAKAKQLIALNKWISRKEMIDWNIITKH